MKQKLLEMVQVNVLFHTFPPLTKTETCAKIAPRAPQSSAWGTLATYVGGRRGLSYAQKT